MPDFDKISIPARHPNFFILGAAKSGTTSLHHYLKQHPQIFMSEVKEPSFFCETFQQINSPKEYFGLFDGVEKEKVIGEASHVYLTDPKSPELLKKHFPDARFLISLRNPAERAFSLYLDMRNHRWETARTFSKALRLEPSRMDSDEFKWNNPQYFYNFLYYHSGLYGQQLQRYFSLFDKSQFHIIKLDDLHIDFDHAISSIFKFLEVDPSVLPEERLYNKTFGVRSHSLQNLLEWTLPESSFKRSLIRHTYSKKPVLDISLKRELMERYQKDQELLFSLCGIRFN
ncbi:sulfotransferase family protein [Roseivirga sp.]|uniref:sulfotransferase family protein n=1 Tax=Roseivirga sp. TaxID=1964215 RepID=UPI003B8C1AA7